VSLIPRTPYSFFFAATRRDRTTMNTIKVALLTRQPRELRVAGIVLAHIKSIKYQFQLVGNNELGAVDICVVDNTDGEMLMMAQALVAERPTVALVHLVDAAGSAGERYELLPGQMMSSLIQMLQRVADELAAKPAAPRVVARSTVVQLAAPVRRPQLRALIVDDSPTVRAQLSNVVARIGMACDSADSAQAALARLADQHYDLIYVDVVMPEMDGYKLTREIKRDRRHKSTPVVILTSQSSPFDRARGALAGCDLYLTKPVTVKAFYDASAKALRKTLAVDDLSAWLTDPTQPAAAPVAPSTVHAPAAAAPARWVASATGPRAPWTARD
jgi:CheY-like chemotaxis protein